MPYVAAILTIGEGALEKYNMSTGSRQYNPRVEGASDLLPTWHLFALQQGLPRRKGRRLRPLF